LRQSRQQQSSRT